MYPFCVNKDTFDTVFVIKIRISSIKRAWVYMSQRRDNIVVVAAYGAENKETSTRRWIAIGRYQTDPAENFIQNANRATVNAC